MGLGKKAIRVNGAEVGVEAIMLGVVTSIGGFLFGYDTGQISAMLIFTDFRTRFGQIPQPDGTREFESIISALLVSLMSIGTLVGALAGAYTSEWFGRRKSIAVGIAFFLVGNAVQLSASTSWGHFTAGRVIAGLGVGNLSVGVPMYQSECCPREIRGAVVASYQLMITIGILVANGINYGVRSIQDQPASWRIVIGLGMVFSLPLGIGIFFVPESPRYLASRNDWEGARLSLGRLRGMKTDLHNSLIEDDYKEMRTVLDKESEVGTGSWLECFTGQPSGIPRLVYRTFLGGAIHFLQQWTGVNYFFYYGATIFAGAGISDPIQVALILGAVNVACTFPGLWMVERFGRRMPLFYGGLWQATWLAIFAGVGVGLDPLVSDVAANLMIVSACLFIASFASTWGPSYSEWYSIIAWVVIGESFPLRTRAKQASLATACNWLGNFMIAFFSPLADSGIGYNLGFVFMGCNFAAALIVYFFLYESRGLSLENTDVMYGVPDLKPWNSHKWVPDGYIDRYTRDSAFWRDDATRVNSEELGRPDDKTKAFAPQKHIEKRV